MSNSTKKLRSHPVLEKILDNYEQRIGNEYPAYRNHVYRVFFNCRMFDASTENEVKYAIAAVMHDIGIWTNDTIDYIDPSIEQAIIFLSQNNLKKWTEEIKTMIYWHHHTTSYKGAYSSTVEIFRRADWMDVSLGLVRFGQNRKILQSYRQLFPNHGFHWFLIKKIATNFLKHPSNALPMFK